MSGINNEDRVLADALQIFGDQVFWGYSVSLQEDQLFRCDGIINGSGEPLLSSISRRGATKVLSQ